MSLGVPPKLTPRSIEFGAASTQVRVDATDSPLLDLEVDVDPLLARAEVFARLAMSEPVREAIAARSGFDPGQIVITSRTPSFAAVARSAREPAAEQRADEIAGETEAKRLLFAAEEGLPIVSIFAQASTPHDAVRLANAGAQGLIRYTNGLEVRRATAPARRVELRQLGTAQGGFVNSGASETVAAMVLVGVFLFWCILVIVGSNVADGLRATRAERSCRNCSALLREADSFCPRCGVATSDGGRQEKPRLASDAPPPARPGGVDGPAVVHDAAVGDVGRDLRPAVSD